MESLTPPSSPSFYSCSSSGYLSMPTSAGRSALPSPRVELLHSPFTSLTTPSTETLSLFLASDDQEYLTHTCAPYSSDARSLPPFKSEGDFDLLLTLLRGCDGQPFAASLIEHVRHIIQEGSVSKDSIGNSESRAASGSEGTLLARVARVVGRWLRAAARIEDLACSLAGLSNTTSAPRCRGVVCSQEPPPEPELVEDTSFVDLSERVEAATSCADYLPLSPPPTASLELTRRKTVATPTNRPSLNTSRGLSETKDALPEQRAFPLSPPPATRLARRHTVAPSSSSGSSLDKTLPSPSWASSSESFTRHSTVSSLDRTSLSSIHAPIEYSGNIQTTNRTRVLSGATSRSSWGEAKQKQSVIAFPSSKVPETPLMTQRIRRNTQTYGLSTPQSATLPRAIPRAVYPPTPRPSLDTPPSRSRTSTLPRLSRADSSARPMPHFAPRLASPPPQSESASKTRPNFQSPRGSLRQPRFSHRRSSLLDVNP